MHIYSKVHGLLSTLLHVSALIRRALRHRHHSRTHKKIHRIDKKTDIPNGKPVLCQRTFNSVFHAVFFYTVKLYSLT